MVFRWLSISHVIAKRSETPEQVIVRNFYVRGWHGLHLYNLSKHETTCLYKRLMEMAGTFFLSRSIPCPINHKTMLLNSNYRSVWIERLDDLRSLDRFMADMPQRCHEIFIGEDNSLVRPLLKGVNHLYARNLLPDRSGEKAWIGFADCEKRDAILTLAALSR